MDLINFCHSLPKVELHAHLNGSLSPSTLTNLRKMQNFENKSEEKEEFTTIVNHTSLDECFKLFSVAHSLTTTPKAVFIATCDVIKEFMEDNVIYLELRSTPRAVDQSMTKREYVEAIIKAFEVCKVQYPSILVKLLISVDRKQGYDAAEENVRLAMEFIKIYPEYVVGIDLSGDPTKGDAFIELLETSRKAGLKIAAHCAEVSNEMEAIDILNFRPDRLGHCTCIHPNLGGTKLLFELLKESMIPIELCLTSNVKCKTVPSYSSHQFKYFYDAGYPLCISTDDKGVFDTSLSKEFVIISSHFELDRTALVKLSASTINYAFANTDEKIMLSSILNNFYKF